MMITCGFSTGRGEIIMTKIFLRARCRYWKNLHDKLTDDVAIYEILTQSPDPESGYMIKEHTIKCYDKAEPEWLMGMAIYDWKFSDYSMANYSGRIAEHISENDNVIIIFEQDDVYGYPFYNFFARRKLKMNFHLHVVFYTYMKVREIKDDTAFLRIIPDVNRCDSVTVFNIAEWIDLGSESIFWLLPENYNKSAEIESLMTVNDIFEDELVEIIRNNDYSTLHSDDKSVFVYSRDTQSFVKHILQDFEVVDPDQYQHSIQEFITPNKGKETCRYLRSLRKRYVKKHPIKMQKETCTYNGNCQGSCRWCDFQSERLWKNTHKKWISLYKQKTEYWNVYAEICGINRLRLGSDGNGVRSLVVFDRCPLSCKYCINRSLVNMLPNIEKTSVAGLFFMLQKDLIYFEESGGGVTFGGGEPLLYADFIAVFKRAFPFIHIAVQTSLNVQYDSVDKLISLVDQWFIDIKDMNPAIYRAYTGNDQFQAIQNLQALVSLVDKEKIFCRVPHIPDYNTPEDISNSVMALKELGITNIEIFEYVCEQTGSVTE